MAPRIPAEDIGDIDDAERIEAEAPADGDEGQDGPEDDAGEDDAGEGDEGEDAPDEGEDDDAGDDEGQEDRSSQVRHNGKPESRAQRRIRQLTEDSKEARRLAAEATERLQRLEQGQQQQRQQETAQARAERLAMMNPDERTSFLLNEQSQHFQNQINAIEFRSVDAADRTQFESLSVRVPVFAKYATRVEEILAAERRAGRNPTRELIAKFLIGDEAVKKAGRATTVQKKRAADNRGYQTARPSGGRSDVMAERRSGSDGAAGRRKRLEGMEI